MSDTRNYPKIEQGLRRRAREAEAQVESLRTAIDAQNEILLGVVLRDVLAEPADFALFVDVERLRGPSGALIWPDVYATLDRLLTDRPYLAAPASDSPRPRGRGALSWLLTGT